MLVPHVMSGKTVGIVGLGSSGMAAAAALGAAGVTIFAHDDNKPDTPLVNGTVMAWRDWPWQNLDALVISPGIPHLHPAPHPAAARAAAASSKRRSTADVSFFFRRGLSGTTSSP